MSLADNYSPTKTLGNGSTDTFTWSWNAGTVDRVKIFTEVVATGVQTEVTSGITKSISTDGSGSVVFDTPPASTVYVIISRETPQTQAVGFTTSRGFEAKVIEDAYDKLTAQNQEQQDEIDRAIKLSLGSTLDLNVPSPTAGRAIKWNSAGDNLINSDNDPDEIVADATAAKVAAEAAQAAAETAKTGAETAETNAETAETNAEDWATKTDGIVQATDYSSKAYSIGGTGVTNGDGAAKEWATKAEDSTVNGVEYSAKHYAAKAAAKAAGINRDSGTFTNADLSAGVLTITHNFGLSAPYPVNVIIYDNNDEMIGGVDSVTGATNSVDVDMTSFGTLTGTWGYVVGG